MMNRKRVFILAGEASGDHHGTDLVRDLHSLMPDCEIVGIGGDGMRRQGVKLFFHISQLAFLGLSEIIKHLPFLWRVQQKVRRELQAGVDAIILVDYPGFNLRIARMASKMKVPVVYYICPQLWAWAEGRVEKIRRFVDLPLVIFKFEEAFYAKHGIKAHFVGHPLVEQLARETVLREDFYQKNNLPAEQPVLALLPGSREMEVRKLLPVMAEVARKISKRNAITPVLGRAANLPDDLYEEILQAYPEIQQLDGQTHALMTHARCAMVASGTATLELGYLQTPMAVLYAVAPLTYFLGRKLVKIENIALANIVLGKTVVPEFIQKDIRVDDISAAMERYLMDEDHYRWTKEELRGISIELGEPGASMRAAQKIVQLLAGSGTVESSP